MTRLFRTYWNLVCHLKKLMKILIKKDVEATEGRGGETSFWGRGGRLGVLVKIPRDSQFVNTFGQIFGASLIGFCHKTAEIHSLCIS